MQPDPSTATTPAIAMAGIGKRFPGVLALENVDLSLAPGKVHALMGENGAGKSTLIKSPCGGLPTGQRHDPDRRQRRRPALAA